MNNIIIREQSLIDVDNKIALAFCRLFDSHKNLIIYLYGDVGAGKTTLVRSILRALGYAGKVQSPSYSVMNIYDLTLSFIHVDLYRFDGFDAPELLLLDEYIDNAIYFIEWPDHAQEGILPKCDLSIHILSNSDQARAYSFFSPHSDILELLSL